MRLRPEKSSQIPRDLINLGIALIWTSPRRSYRQSPKDKTVKENISLDPEDFYVREREQLITSTTVVLLDLSWSMSWEGRFEAAKRVALALEHYVRTRFPKDKLHVVGFSTEARELKGKELSLVNWDPQPTLHQPPGRPSVGHEANKTKWEQE